MSFTVKKQANLKFKKNTTFKIPRQAVSFLPSSLGGLALWLKADAGTTTEAEQFVNQIVLTGAIPIESSGTYTRSSGGNTNFIGPNGNYIEYVEGGIEENYYFVLYDTELEDYTFTILINPQGDDIVSIEPRNPSYSYESYSLTTGLTGNLIVTAWADQSGNGFIFTKDIQNEPTYLSSFVNGKPAIEFTTNANTGLSNTSFGLTGFTFFSVAKQKPTNGGRIFSSYYGNVLIGTWGNESNRFYGGNENGWLYEGTNQSTDFLITTAFSDADTSFGFYQNGILQSNGNSNSTVILNGISVGGGIWNGGNIEASDSYVCEIVIYNRTLTLTERQQVEAYLNQKYQIY